MHDWKHAVITNPIITILPANIRFIFKILNFFNKIFSDSSGKGPKKEVKYNNYLNILTNRLHFIRGFHRLLTNRKSKRP